MDERRIEDKDKSFKANDGTVLLSLKDLYGYLSVMKDEDFVHHVTEHKNDFASWVEHVHGDKFLASSMRRASTKEELRKAIFVAMFR